jgi:hypothetical protein
VTAVGVRTPEDQKCALELCALVSGPEPEERPVASWDLWASIGVDKPLPR